MHSGTPQSRGKNTYHFQRHIIFMKIDHMLGHTAKLKKNKKNLKTLDYTEYVL